MIKIFDACAVIAYLRGEPGAEVVESLLLDKGNQCLAHAVNWCEVYYDFWRGKDEGAARDALFDLSSAGVITREDMEALFLARSRQTQSDHQKSFFGGLFRPGLDDSHTRRAYNFGSSRA